MGHVRIYRLEDDGISWELSGEDIDGEAEFDELGTPVSLSANGSTILIGASSYVPKSTGYYVKVYRTDDDGGNRVQIGQTLSSNATEDYFGNFCRYFCGWHDYNLWFPWGVRCLTRIRESLLSYG